jgi:hypothetical protein
MKKECWHILLRAIHPSCATLVMCLVAAAILSPPSKTQAADTLVYSFESGLEGFQPNGLGTTVTQDTIGATHGTQSMKVAITGGTFVGAQTAPNTLHPAIGDPPGLDHVLFDLTFTEPFPEASFAVVGVMVFGVDQNGFPVQLQTGPSSDNEELEWHIDGREPGTYTDIRMDMTQFLHPVTFDFPATFNDIVGTQGSGPNDMVPTSFQLYFNKSGGLANSLTVYIDNIRVGMTMAGIEGDFNDDGVVDTADYVMWKKLNDSGVETGLANDPTPDVIDSTDYDTWVRNFGTGVGTGGGGTAVPDPASAVLLAVVGLLVFSTNRLRAVR